MRSPPGTQVTIRTNEHQWSGEVVDLGHSSDPAQIDIFIILQRGGSGFVYSADDTNVFRGHFKFGVWDGQINSTLAVMFYYKVGIAHCSFAQGYHGGKISSSR